MDDSPTMNPAFGVYRSTDSPNSFAPIGEGQVNEVAYFDHTAQCGHTEYYLVRAFNPAGEIGQFQYLTRHTAGLQRLRTQRRDHDGYLPNPDQPGLDG